MQHSESKKHILNRRTKLSDNQTTLNFDNTTGVNKMELLCKKDNAYRSELIWTMKTVCCNIPAATADGIVDTFRAMFPEGVPNEFSLGRTKLSYLITDALGPYFREQFLQDIKSSFFSLLFDETTNVEGKKELQVAVKYWSQSRNEVVTYHLETFFMGHSTAEQLVSNIMKSIDNANISIKHILALGCDGPNVNKKVFRLVNEIVKSMRTKSIMDIGSCNIHTVHNSFLKGLTAFDSEAVDFLTSIYAFFSDWPSRLEDLADIQSQLNLPQRRLIKHVSSRWLTLEPAIRRLMEQWDAYHTYFTKFIPSKQPQLQKNFYYKKIHSGFSNKCMKAELNFISNTARMFTVFTAKLQKKEPLIHELYDDLKSLVLSLANRVFHLESLQNIQFDIMKIGDKLQANDSVDFIKPNNFLCGDEIKELLVTWPKAEKEFFVKKCMTFLKTSCKHTIEKSSLTANPVLKYFRFLKPDYREKEISVRDMLKVANIFPLNINGDILHDEWKCLQRESFPADMKTSVRIDHYWNYIIQLKDSSGNIKFPNVSTLIKAALSLPHGSAEVERGFSWSARVLTEDKASMSIRMLNARLNVAEGLKRYDNKPELVPITKELLKLANSAYSHYKEFMENEKRIASEKLQLEKDKEAEKEKIEKDNAAIVKKRKQINEMEQIAKQLEKEKDTQTVLADKLFQEATDRLKKGIEKQDFLEIKLAQSMLEAAQTRRNEEKSKYSEANGMRKNIEKRKSVLISDFFTKKVKK